MVVPQTYLNKQNVRSAVTATAVLLVGYWISIAPISYGHTTQLITISYHARFFQESRLDNTRLRENVSMPVNKSYKRSTSWCP